MLSAVVVVLDGHPSQLSAEAVVRTLSALVPAAVEGVLRDVTLAALEGRAGMRKIADHAGCELVEAPNLAALFRRAFESTRNNDIFAIRAGRAPEQGFADELADILAGGDPAALMRDNPRALFTRIFPGFAPISGVLARRDRLLRAPSSSFSALARHAQVSQTLRSRARFVE